MAIILDGKALADKITIILKEKVLSLKQKPTLAVVKVGNDEASQIYVQNKIKKAQEIGINAKIIQFSDDISQSWLETEVEKLANDEEINAILVQLPLPKGLDAKRIIEKIPPQKDVDGFHPYNLGKLLSGEKPYFIPCTPLGIIELLKEYSINIAGKNAVIIGRSNIVGKPLAALMTNMDATVTLCHSKTTNLKEITKRADIVVAAIGNPQFITADYIKQDAVVIDVGINRDENGKIIGDVDFEEVKNIASHITPVPKGIGPMTIAMLMQNTLRQSINIKL